MSTQTNETKTSQPASTKLTSKLEVSDLVNGSSYNFKVLSLNSIGMEQSHIIFFSK